MAIDWSRCPWATRATIPRPERCWRRCVWIPELFGDLRSLRRLDRKRFQLGFQPVMEAMEHRLYSGKRFGTA